MSQESAKIVALPTAPRGKVIHPEYVWSKVRERAKALAPEAWGRDGTLNLVEGEWGEPGNSRAATSPIDGTHLGTLPWVDEQVALKAVAFAHKEAKDWAKVSLEERCARVQSTMAILRTHKEILVQLIMWEIGKSYAAANSSVDRFLSGVEWYLGQIEGMLKENPAPGSSLREPLGLVSNIASWNYPLSVLVHAIMVQVLCGNGVIAKTPTDGGAYSITVCLAIARRNGLPVSLVSGSGGTLSAALVRNDLVDCLSFVGGRSVGRNIAASLVDTSKRYMLEMEGVNVCGVWNFSDWELFAKQLKRSYDYGKQRCTAFPRFVVQRQLFPKFLETYLGVVRGLKTGNPVAVSDTGGALPEIDFGPLITASKVEELRQFYSEAVGHGGVPLHEGQVDKAALLPGQDNSTYFAPTAVLNPPRSCRMYHSEPFGPLDSILLVDRLDELIAEMNISNGCLVSWLACDDKTTAATVRSEVRAFKFGHNTIRSRGDNDEAFGGLGASWKGCFVGGRYLVQGLTRGPSGEQLYGNYGGLVRVPEGV